MKNVSIVRKMRKPLAAVMALIFSVISVSPSLAQGAIAGSTLGLLPEPGSMVAVSSAFKPTVLKGIKVFPDNPFRFDFILERGNDPRELEDLKPESTKLIKYFLASLTIPETDMWVNLSPYEKERIVPNEFGLTEMGRDMLAQDYLLKQITASVIYPEGEVGKKFWAEVYKRASDAFGTSDIPMETFNKVWIVPSKAVVFENGDKAFVVESHMKVMLEGDYTLLQNAVTNGKSGVVDASTMEAQELGKNVIRDIVIPVLEREVNEGQNFAPLRQVYESLILATWFKQKIKDSILDQVYVDKKKIVGVNNIEDGAKEQIYQMYLKAFKSGVYNYVKEEVDPMTEELLPRKYFSGGVSAIDMAQLIEITLEKEGIDFAQANLGVISAQIDGARNDKAMLNVDPFEVARMNFGYLTADPQAAVGENYILNGRIAVISGIKDGLVEYVLTDENGKRDVFSVSEESFARGVVKQEWVLLSSNELQAIDLGRDYFLTGLTALQRDNNDLYQSVMKLLGETLGFQPDNVKYRDAEKRKQGFFGDSFLLIKGDLLSDDVERILRRFIFQFPVVNINGDTIRLAYSQKIVDSTGNDEFKAESETLINLIEIAIGKVKDYVKEANDSSTFNLISGQRPWGKALQSGQWVKIRLGAEEVTFQRNADAIVFSYLSVPYELSMNIASSEMITDFRTKARFAIQTVGNDSFFIVNHNPEQPLEGEVLESLDTPNPVVEDALAAPDVDVITGDIFSLAETQGAAEEQPFLYTVSSVEGEIVKASRVNVYGRDVEVVFPRADFNKRVQDGGIVLGVRQEKDASTGGIINFLDRLVDLKSNDLELYHLMLKFLADLLLLRVENVAAYVYEDFKGLRFSPQEGKNFLSTKGPLNKADEDMILQELAFHYARLDLNRDNLRLAMIRYGVEQDQNVLTAAEKLISMFTESQAAVIPPVTQVIPVQGSMTVNVSSREPAIVIIGKDVFTLQLNGPLGQEVLFTRQGGQSRTVRSSTKDGVPYRFGNLVLQLKLQNGNVVMTNIGNKDLSFEVFTNLTAQAVEDLKLSRTPGVAAEFEKLGLTALSPVVLDVLDAGRKKLEGSPYESGGFDIANLDRQAQEREEQFLRSIFARMSMNRSEPWVGGFVGELIDSDIETARASQIAASILNGQMDSPGVLTPAERSKVFKILLLEGKVWTTTSGTKVSLPEMLLAKGGILEKYFKYVTVSRFDIDISENFAETVVSQHESIYGKDLDAQQRNELVEYAKEKDGLTTPYAKEGKWQSVVALDSTQPFITVLSTMLHEIAHVMLISRSTEMLVTKETRFIHEGLASDFVTFALASLAVNTANNKLYEIAERYKVKQLALEDSIYLWGRLFIEAVRKSNPQTWSAAVQGSIMNILGERGSRGLQTLADRIKPNKVKDLSTDKAQTPGGIDFNAAQMNLAVQNSGENIRFNLDPAMMQQLQDAPGFSPVVINIAPLNNLSLFLGVEK